MLLTTAVAEERKRDGDGVEQVRVRSAWHYVLLSVAFLVLCGSCERKDSPNRMVAGAPPISSHQKASDGAAMAPAPSAVSFEDWPRAPREIKIPDLGFLNDEHGPAGSHGRLVRKGDALRFEDGTLARFFGVNVTASALFVNSDEVIAAAAARISSLGVNLVRIHHHDSHWVKPNVFEDGDSTQRLNHNALERIGRWVYELGRRGIYTWLDLEVGRRYRSGDGVEAYHELPEGEARGFTHVNRSILRHHQQFVAEYLKWKNPHTGHRLGEEPGVVFALVSNENDLTTHFGNAMLPDKGRPAHTRMFEDAARPIIAREKLPRKRALRLWEPGPGKVLQAHLEKDWATGVVAFAQPHLLHALVAPTSTWGKSPLWSLFGLTPGEFVDVHSYDEEGLLRRDPRAHANLVAWMGAAALEGYPVTVSEWNVPPPASDRFVAPGYVAAVAALQGWDAILLYAFAQRLGKDAPQRRDRWSSGEDPALLEQIPNAALLFRRGDVVRARETVVLSPSEADVYERKTSPLSSRALRTVVERNRVVVRLPHRSSQKKSQQNERIVTDMNTDFSGGHHGYVTSDTGELRRDFRRGIFFIETEKTRGASGRLGGAVHALGSVEISIANPEAAVFVTSLDDRPIQESRRLMLVATGRASVKEEKLPYFREPVLGTVRFDTLHEKFSVKRLGSGETSQMTAPGRLEVDLRGGGFILLSAE